MPSVGVVPAAGSAERFGSAKMLSNIGGMPLLERTIRALLDGGVERVTVVLGPNGARLRSEVAALADRRVSTATNRHPERGMLSSIQAGLREAKGGDPILVLPGDMPYVEPATVAALLQRYQEEGGIVSPRFQGKRGHPVVIPGTYRDEILAAEGVTLHEVLRAHAGERVDMDVYDRGVVRDVDVPSDLTEEGAP